MLTPIPEYTVEPGQSLQVQFESVAAHLLRQGVRSVDAEGDCVYRGENGMMCAAGCRVPGDFYTPRMEGANWRGVCTKIPDCAKYLDPEIGKDLQNIHDNTEPEYWAEQLAFMAEERGLEVPDWLKERI